MQITREELLESYSAMSTEELLDHWESGTLTDLAMEIARNELVQRGVALPSYAPVVETSEPDTDTDTDTSAQSARFEIVARAFTATEVQILRGRLEAEGIPAFVVDENISQTTSFLSVGTDGVGLQVNSEHAEEATRIIAEIKSGERALVDEGPEKPSDNPASESRMPDWEIVVSALILIFALFDFLKTMWFVHTFTAAINWDTVAVFAIALPVLYLLGALLLVFRSKWAIGCFALHLLLSAGSVIFLMSDIPADQVVGWLCSAAIIYFCIHLRRTGRSS